MKKKMDGLEQMWFISGMLTDWPRTEPGNNASGSQCPKYPDFQGMV